MRLISTRSTIFLALLSLQSTAKAQNYSLSVNTNSSQIATEVQLPIADGKWKFLGNIYSNSQKSGFTDYWNQVTPENAGKWGSVEYSKDKMNWTELDATYKLAKDNGFPFKLHVMIWGSQQPSWIENMTPGEQLLQIQEWFAAVSERYPDIDIIEVVNEPLHQAPDGVGKGNYINALGGSGTSGWDWVIESFRMAREYFPDSHLMINDYGIINDGNAVTKYMNIVNLLKAEELVDGVGFQCHAFNNTAATATLKNNLNRLATLELPLYVTELDIDGPTDEKQLSEYQRIFPIFWEHKAVAGVTLWGYRPGLWRNDQKAYIINSDGTERPAMTWLREYVAGSLVSVKELKDSPEISIFPNPVTDNEIWFSGVENISSIKVFDLNGQQMYAQQNFNESNVHFNLDVNPGIYVIQFTNNITSYSRKIVVR